MQTTAQTVSSYRFSCVRVEVKSPLTQLLVKHTISVRVKSVCLCPRCGGELMEKPSAADRAVLEESKGLVEVMSQHIPKLILC